MDARIGITTSYIKGEQRLDHAYVRAVERAGGMPVIVPMLENEGRIRAFAATLDGLVITGGPAVTDGLLGTLPEDLAETDPVRLRSDRVLLASFLPERKPLLGICYGMQFLNAAAGGTIFGDVERQLPHAMPHSEKRGATDHEIRIDESSGLYQVLKKRDLVVNTRHVQAVAHVGPPFHAVARSPDGVVEAIETRDGTMVGVQFHPEQMGDEMLPLFRHLIEKAREFAARTRSGT